MKILIPGGAGYLGSILVPMLLAEGHQVTVLDRFIYGNDTALAACVSDPKFDVHYVDCRDIDAVRPHVASADVVIPLAGLVGVPVGNANPIDAELLNLKAQLGLFTLLSSDQLVIMPTTESSYGSNAEVCTEETPLNPLSLYAKHKVDVENALLARGNSISLRLATVFGWSPRMRLDLLINDFTWKAYREHSILVSEHRFKRTVVHVRDVARAFEHCLPTSAAMPMVPLGIYNVGAFSLTKLELCDAIKDKNPHFFYTLYQGKTDPDQRNYVVSSAKLEATGYRFTVNLSDGLDELLKGYRMIGVGPHRNA